MSFLPIFISMIFAVVALSDWRRGLLFVIVIGVLQDVFRKLTPGVPAYFIIWSMAAYLVMAAVAIFAKSLPPMTAIHMKDENVRRAWNLFIIVIALQLVNAFIRWGNPIVPLFGALFYLGPVLSILVGFAFANNEKRLRQFLLFYVVILVPACLTVFLSPPFEETWPVLRDVGSFLGRELVIYDVGALLQSYSGILRVGEISAWHAATASIFLVTLAITARGSSNWILTTILVALLIGVIILTGRRKMLMTLTIFFSIQWALMAMFRKGLVKVSLLIILVGTTSSFSLTLLEPASESTLYVQRGSTVFGESTGRLGLAVDLMKSAFSRSAGLGLGAGAADQGARYAGIDVSDSVGGSSESGLGKVMIELGIIGIFSILWLLIAAGKSLQRNLKILARTNLNLFLYQASLISFLFANIMTFTVATQVYGDYFVLIVLGTTAGFVVRINSLAGQLGASKRMNQALSVT